MAHRNDLRRLALLLFCLAFAGLKAASADGLANATVLIIRHAEKPDEGNGLAPAGEARAKAYIQYFKNYKLDSEPLKLDAIFAAADSRNSRRPRITVEPLAQALGLTVNASYKDKDYQAFVNELRSQAAGKSVLVCWHHGVMPGLLQALGADPNALLPGGHWPGDQYDWLLVLRYDATGKIRDAQRVAEGF